MEVHYLILCCVLFTTVASFNSLGAHLESSQSCNCENGRCVTDNEDHLKCACLPGYSLQDKFTCKPCDCGPLGKCIFTLNLARTRSSGNTVYEKKCVCDKGSAVKDGVCVECFCGENSACDFDYGKRRCYCLDGYSEKDKVCTRCDCGFYGTCKYRNGVKTCQCDNGYLVLNGICTECNCGSNSVSCNFVNGNKQCQCRQGYADRYGTCEACNCGSNSVSCNFNNNQKTCNCITDYVQKGETCQLGCSNRNPCQNGGFCKGGFCFCNKGTRGEFCEVVNDCQNGLCGFSPNVKCLYDRQREGGVCQCTNPSYLYDPQTKTCKACDCGANSVGCDLRNGRKVCSCRDGYEDKNGSCRKARCVEKSCQNGRCEVLANDQEVCSCYEGYELMGDNCRKLPCKRTSCANGDCIVRRTGLEDCLCPPNHTARNGTCYRGTCWPSKCFGGLCVVEQNEFLCRCPEGYSLQGIGCFATPCKNKRCFGGECTIAKDFVTEVCKCPENRYLDGDVCRINLCNTPNTRCLGGNCQRNQGMDTCECPPGNILHPDGACRGQSNS